MTKKEGYSIRVIDTLYNHVPAFTDLFDEETWYIFVTCVVVVTTLLVVIVSRYITIKPVE